MAGEEEMSSTVRRLTGFLLVALTAGLLAITVAPAAMADCQYTGGADGGLSVITGHCHSTGSLPGTNTGGGPYIPNGPPPPAYKDYWTPTCSVNGPPGNDGGAMCMAAATVCKTRGQANAIFMQHWRQQVSPTVGPWTFVANECRGPDAPTQQQPQVTQAMVLDQAYAAAPHPTAMVQPGNHSFVNFPNNYYADAADQTQTVNVLGHAIVVRFTVDQVTWDFGDGQSATGVGSKDADQGAPGSIEHAYARQGSYRIVANSRVSVQFTLPTGRTVNLPGAFSFASDPVVLPVGEIETRVNEAG
jgi:hypothetical protein